MRKRISKIAAVLSILFGTLSGVAAAADGFNVEVAPPERRLSPQLQEGGGEEGVDPEASWTPARVSVCTNIAAKTCKTADLPPETGYVNNIVRGNWVSPVAASASWLAFTDQHATLCYMGTRTTSLQCFPIHAFAPPDTDVEFADMGSGLKALIFKQRPGATQPLEEYYRSVQIFTRALDAAALVVQEHAKSTLQAAFTASAAGRDFGVRTKIVREGVASPSLIDDSSCGTCTIGSDGTYDQGSWETWDDTSDYWDYDTGTWSPASDVTDLSSDKWDFPRVIIGPPAGEPEASNNFFPPFEWNFAAPVLVGPDLPPQPDWPEQVTVANTTTCTFRGFLVVCTAPRPAPLPLPADPADQPLKPATPWLPSIPTWNFCDTLGIFCSEDNDRGDGASHDGKTIEELKQICTEIMNTEIKVCNTQYTFGADFRTVQACRDRAAGRHATCLRTAEKSGK